MEKWKMTPPTKHDYSIEITDERDVPVMLIYSTGNDEVDDQDMERVLRIVNSHNRLEEAEAFLKLARERIHSLEAVIEHFNETLTATGREREIAWNQVMTAMQQTFREAVILDRDMSEEQRSYWLASDSEPATVTSQNESSRILEE